MVDEDKLIELYDEHQEIQAELDYIKENWKEFYEDYEECPDDESILNDIYQSDTVNRRWEDFLNSLDSILEEKSSGGCWESPDYKYADDRYPDAQFCPDKAIEFLDALYSLGNYGVTNVKVYEMDDEGLEIILDGTSRIAMPACEAPFYRDWDNDGVCVLDREEDEDIYDYL